MGRTCKRGLQVGGQAQQLALGGGEWQRREGGVGAAGEGDLKAPGDAGEGAAQGLGGGVDVAGRAAVVDVPLPVYGDGDQGEGEIGGPGARAEEGPGEEGEDGQGVGFGRHGAPAQTGRAGTVTQTRR